MRFPFGPLTSGHMEGKLETACDVALKTDRSLEPLARSELSGASGEDEYNRLNHACANSCILKLGSELKLAKTV